MQIFRDKSGIEWTVELNAGSIIRIRAESSGRFDFYNPSKDELATTLADDLPTCWEALWFVCSPQAKAKSIDAEQFGRLLADEALLAGQKALLDEWRDFFHRLNRDEWVLVVDKAAKYQAKKLELVRAKLADPLLATLDQRVEAKMTAELNHSFGSLAEKLAKTLDHSPSGSLTD